MNPFGLIEIELSGAALSAALTARHPDGRAWSRPYTLSGSVPDAENAAPRLVWAQHRCRHLLDAGRRSEAIELAIAPGFGSPDR